MVRGISRSRCWLGGLVMALGAAWAASPSFGQDMAWGGKRYSTCPAPATQQPECARPDITAPPLEKSEAVAPQVPLAPTIPTEQFAALPGETVALANRSAVGYIDPAIPL